MKKKAMLAGILSLALLCGCAAQPPETPADDDTPPEALHALGLTAEQRMEDYEYFWSTLRDSYPCWGILEREGVDPDEIYESYREMVAEHDSDVSFYSAIYSSLWLLGRNGHLWIVEPDDYRSWRQNADALRAEGKDRWAELLTSEETAAKYEALQTMLDALGEDEPWSGGGADGANVSTLLIPEAGTAYVKIASFGGDMEADRPILDAFYASLGGCGDLIIDVSENSGGSERYWQDLLVAPNIDRPLRCTNYALTRLSDNNRPFLEGVFAPEELHPIGALPELPRLAAADRALATHFVESTLSVEPAAARSPFRGRVWVLVSDRVYSASESFAVFCRQTGFATLVGTQTGGDGIGALEPVFLQLPNSGILVQFTAMYGLNPDGSSNEETGTAPDVASPAGESPLVAALRAIEAQKG